MKIYQDQTVQENPHLQNNDESQKYVVINKVKEPVSKDLYYEYMRLEWAERKGREREGRCRGKNGSRCTEDCLYCKVDRKGRTKRPLASDKLKEIERQSCNTPDLLEQVINKQLNEELKTVLSMLDAGNRRLIVMIFFKGMTEREVAARIGLSQKGVNKRKVKILKKLREHLKFFYE